MNIYECTICGAKDAPEYADQIICVRCVRLLKKAWETGRDAAAEYIGITVRARDGRQVLMDAIRALTPPDFKEEEG